MDFHMYNYDKLMSANPERLGTVYGEVALYEHPTYGEDVPVIAVSHKHKLAWCSTFYDPWNDQGDCEIILEDFQELTAN